MMMMVRKSKGLSERHQKILAYLETYQGKHGYPPSIREIGEKTGISSTSVVNYYLDQLQKMGYIERVRGISRGVKMTEKNNDFNSAMGNVKVSDDIYRIPIAGQIVASAPVPVPASDFNYFDPESSVEIARSLLPVRDTKDLFALKVKGDSMVDAMVNDGDIVVMKKAEKANNGDMVAVWLPERDETTLKYFYKEKDGFRLQPANPTMKAIRLRKNEKIEIKGKVVMVIRQVATSIL